ncbi:hypothetical protein CIL05_07640 [Virgibacillus profundi]|uniref:Uncharacterized protein n=1 Tax=Virgibacillus profundi TaxID=2024555 RepID=A0A2A2IGG3_9BACI|nr:hypothetical protein [Virgibacillus profundi]PAV30334.1 hypothetical protein CIL05_07640 [Virgibacillus profundi]PXY54506.1 hypothetical protein CIT14_07725 [Virgibacillus profundi]
MKIFKRLFKSDKETIDSDTSSSFSDEINPKVELKCVGTYSFDVIENPESVEEFTQRMSEEGFRGWYAPPYYTYHIIVNFKANVKYNNSNFDVADGFKMGTYSENEAYTYLYRLLKEGGEAEVFNDKLKNNIVASLDNQLQENSIESIKSYLENNEPLAFDFTFKTDKTENMQ